MKIYILFIALFLLLFDCFGQSDTSHSIFDYSKINKLESTLIKEKNVNNRNKIMLEIHKVLSEDYYNNLYEIQTNANRILKSAIELKDTLLINEANGILYEIYTYSLSYNQMNELVNSMINFFNNSDKFNHLLTNWKYHRAALYHYQELNDSALVYYQELKDIYTENKDTVGLIKTSVNILSLKTDKNKYEQNYQQFITIYKLLDDYNGALKYQLIFGVYKQLGQLEYEQENYDNAKALFKMSGSGYAKINNDLKHYFEGKHIYTNYLLGKIAFKKKDYLYSLEITDSLLIAISKNRLEIFSELHYKLLQLKVQCLLVSGQKDKGIETITLLSEAEEIYRNEEREAQKKITLAKLRIDKEKKEVETELKYEKEIYRLNSLKQKYTLFGLIIIFGILIILMFFIRNRFLMRRKLLLKEKELLQEKLAGKERKLVSSLIHTAKNTDFLNKLLSRFKTISSKENIFDDIKKEIKELIRFENEWKTIKKHFEDVHPDFFTKLQSKVSSLTEYEMKLCAYLLINLTNKELSGLLGIEISSVKSAKNRLKKKLNISQEDSIYKFLRAL